MKRVKPHLPYLIIIWIVCGGIYLKTLAPSILYVDAGAMITAAFEPGIPNPPGFPSYVLLGHLFTKIPLGTVLFRLQLLSILSALGILTMVYFLIQRLFATKIIALVSSLILAFSYQFWSQTLNSESYIFTNFLMISMLTLLLTIPENPKNLTKRLLFGSALLGIASGANPTIVQVVPTLLIGGIFWWKKIGVQKLIYAIVVTAVFTASVYAYLPIRAKQYPFLNWGNPQTWQLFVGHIKGEGLDINDPRTNSINGFTGSPQIFAQSTGKYFYLALLQFTPVLVPLILLGIYVLWQKNRRLFLILSAIPVTNLIFGGLYLSGNQESWFIASYIIFAIFIGVGMDFGLKILRSFNLIRQSRMILWTKSLILNPKSLSILPFAFCLLPLIWWFPKLDRSSHITTSEYAINLYSKLPSGSVMIGSGDFFNSMSLYDHEVTKSRPDVFPVVANMWYILPWYRDNLRHQRPDLMPQQLETMIKKDRFEEYNEVMNWYIKWLIDRGHPVYITPTVFRETVLAGTDAGKYVPDKNMLKAVPMGLSFRMLTANDLLQPSEDSFVYQFKDPDFYKKPPFYLERNYNAAYHLLLEEYGIGYLSLADYFAGNVKSAEGDQKQILRQKAAEYTQKAYQIAPFSMEVVNRKAIFTALSGDIKGGIKYFKEALALGSDNMDVRLNLAKALLADNQVAEAQKQLQMIVGSDANSQIKDEAQKELSKITASSLQSSVPSNWKKYSARDGWQFQYPQDWKVSMDGRIVILKSPGGNFSISMYKGILSGVSKDDWVKTGPIKFSGRLENKGAAQIPPFDATAAFWEDSGVKALEFVLVQGNNVLHLKVTPVGAAPMENLDQILSTIKFNQS